ncbi:peroxisomal (S)-2-hydroxy-acid oxidase GLO3-like isoform X2 [Bradysia coprophila]|uniref:peroxisomal (S)-2-hydroxy-acid oxidase GLO3-like isoform X2 n=1 Tax=Bradysia coprophila TaxID=38358 RepID=UPI00187D874B|nr:peroxisomal (S)-2-hydroxy-acid oxidase GLO3-like isoform X2 [Bradysia coprophila]
MYHFIFYSCCVGGLFQLILACEPITVEDYEDYAKQRLPLASLEYLQRGADKDYTLKRNCEAFSRIKVIPRYLLDVSNRSTKAEALGKSFKLPVGIAPSGLQKRWHPDGELATIRASNAANTIMIVSSASSVSFEDVVKEAPDAEKWMQMFLFENDSITQDFVKQAEHMRFGAIVVTIDMSVPPLRYFNKRNMWKDVHAMANFARYIDEDGRPLQFKFHQATWIQLQKLINSTNLPVIVKGVVTLEDAILCYQYGAKGIIVSNHGGRQIDGTISSIEALSDIISNFRAQFPASRNEFEIYLDGGIRSGIDVFRALAIGAKFVFVGRAPLYGLVHSGQQGVENVLEIFRRELDTLLGQTGCNSIEDIGTRHVRYQFPF